MASVLVNGNKQDKISVSDRGLQYGDGLFETIAVINKSLLFWDEHWHRLIKGCEQLSIVAPEKTSVEKDIEILISQNKNNKFVIKLIVTRGEGNRGYSYSEKANTTRILSSHSWPEYASEYKTVGVDVCYCETILSENEKLAGIKHLNRLEQVLARNEWQTDEFQEGLMLTRNGHVVDGTMSNVFAVKDNILFTPELSLCGVSGVMRKVIINLAKQKSFSVYEKTFSQSELELADELFLTNSLFGIWPIKRIGKTQFTKVGPVTELLLNEVNKLGLQ